MATSSDINVGTFIRHDGKLVQIEEYTHRTPGNLRAFYQAVMRDVKTGRKVEYRFRSGEPVETVRIEEKTMQFLYKDGDSYVMMDTETYDQLYMDGVIFGDSARFMKETMDVRVFFDGEDAVNAIPPKQVELEITYTEPGLSGDTATKTLKPATVETGAEIRVPLFVNAGDKVRIDTASGDYIERVK